MSQIDKLLDDFLQKEGGELSEQETKEAERTITAFEAKVRRLETIAMELEETIVYYYIVYFAKAYKEVYSDSNDEDDERMFLDQDACQREAYLHTLQLLLMDLDELNEKVLK